VTVLVAAALVVVAAGGTAVGPPGGPAAPAGTLGGAGLLVTRRCAVLEAPDVGLAQLAVGTVVVPLMVMLTVGANARAARKRRR